MTKLIVGLGNPGSRYQNTRHNVGYAVVSLLGERHKIAGKSQGPAIVGAGEIAGERVVIAQPTTFMNDSGRAVAQLLRKHQNVEAEDVLIVVDEMDLPTGTIRARAKGSAGGHNGLKSIIAALGTNEFPRMRIGVDRPPPGLDPIEHVLTRFRPDEREAIDTAIVTAADAVEYWIQYGIDETMNRFNR
jgi:PTH1 family peptidyl-tRNA hydrolase